MIINVDYEEKKNMANWIRRRGGGEENNESANGMIRVGTRRHRTITRRVNEPS